MPNGNPNFNQEILPKLEEIFAPFSDELEKFAKKHNLLVDKYWHQFYSWRFSFKHPKGGIGCLEFSKETESLDTNSLFVIYSFWWLDDYDKSTRFHHRSETDFFEAETGKLTQMLGECFDEILCWQLDQWTNTTCGFEDSWNIYSREEFYKLVDKYPIPKN